eukprot:scaffold5595_cov141-Pinguiococcus_pyrenoidosus.AAC.1
MQIPGVFAIACMYWTTFLLKVFQKNRFLRVRSFRVQSAQPMTPPPPLLRCWHDADVGDPSP